MRICISIVCNNVSQTRPSWLMSCWVIFMWWEEEVGHIQLQAKFTQLHIFRGIPCQIKQSRAETLVRLGFTAAAVLPAATQHGSDSAEHVQHGNDISLMKKLKTLVKKKCKTGWKVLTVQNFFVVVELKHKEMNSNSVKNNEEKVTWKISVWKLAHCSLCVSLKQWLHVLKKRSYGTRHTHRKKLTPKALCMG